MVVGGCKFHLQRLPHKTGYGYKVPSCVFMLISIEKNRDFLFLVLSPLPLETPIDPHQTLCTKYTSPCCGDGKVKEREEAQKEAVQAFCNAAKHEYRYLIFYKIIYKIILILNIMIPYFAYKVKKYPHSHTAAKSWDLNPVF